MNTENKFIITVFGHGKTTDSIDKIAINIIGEADSRNFSSNNKNAEFYLL